MAAGGARPKDPALGRGFYFQPTLLDSVSPDMRVAQEEIFGPVLAIIDFDEIDQAAALANRSDYGLVAGIWTRDINKAMSLASRIKSGQVYTTRTVRVVASSCRLVGTRKVDMGARRGWSRSRATRR